jgi:hypothetical protein
MTRSTGHFPRPCGFLTLGKHKNFIRRPPGWRGNEELNGDIREAHVSTESHRSQAPSWLSQAHAHRWRPEGSCPPPCQGPQAALRLGVCATAPAPGLVAGGDDFDFADPQGARRIPRGPRWPAFIHSRLSDRNARATDDRDRRNRPPLRFHDHQEDRQCRDPQPHPAETESCLRRSCSRLCPAIVRLCDCRAPSCARPAICASP